MIIFCCRSIIFLEDGHLTIAAQTNKNLTLMTTGSEAKINLLADNVASVILPDGSSSFGGASSEEALARGRAHNEFTHKMT